jgi:hypothetical protein
MLIVLLYGLAGVDGFAGVNDVYGWDFVLMDRLVQTLGGLLDVLFLAQRCG